MTRHEHETDCLPEFRGQPGLDGRFPWTYLDKSLEEILRPLDIKIDEFVQLCDKFTNKKIFKRDSSGMLIKDKDGNLTKINYDNS